MNIELIDISKSFAGDRPILNELSASFDRGLIAISGPSGSGKTTLARLIVGEESPSSGEVLIDGLSVRTLGAVVYRKIAYVPVDPPVFGMLSVDENLALILKERKKRKELLTRLGLSKLAKRKAAILSKGETARLGILLGLAREGEALLLDEPTANLDEENAEAVFTLLSEEAHRRLVIVFTHDEKRAKERADHAYRLEGGKLVLVKEKAPLASSAPHSISGMRGALGPYFKIGFRIATRKPLAYGIATFLLFLSMGISSFCFTLMFTDGRATFEKAFALPEYSHVSITFDDAKLEGSFGNPSSFLKAFPGEAVEMRPLFVKGNGSNREEVYAVEEGEAEDLGFPHREEGDSSHLSIVEKIGDFSIVDTITVETLTPVSFLERLHVDTGIAYEAGDILPLCFDERKSFVEVEFVLAGTYEFDFHVPAGERGYKKEPPLLLPDDFFEKIASHRGLDLLDFGYGADSLQMDLEEFAAEEGIGEEIPNISSILQRPYLGMDCLPLPFREEGEELDPEEPLVLYAGKLPKESGELLVPVRSLYEFFAHADNGAFASYFREKGTGFSLPFSPMGIEEAKIVGYYVILGPAVVDESGNYVEDEYGTPKRPYVYADEAPIILSADDMEKARDYVIEDGWNPAALETAYLVKGSLLGEWAEELGLLGSDYLVNYLGNRFDYTYAFVEARLLSLLSGLLLVIVGLAGILTSFIYLLRSAKESAADRELLVKMGQGKASLILSVGASLTLILPALLLGLPLGLLGVYLLAKSFVADGLFPVAMVVSYPLGILLTLALSLVLELLLFASSNSWGKKHG